MFWQPFASTTVPLATGVKLPKTPGVNDSSATTEPVRLYASTKFEASIAQMSQPHEPAAFAPSTRRDVGTQTVIVVRSMVHALKLKGPVPMRVTMMALVPRTITRTPKVADVDSAVSIVGT